MKSGSIVDVANEVLKKETRFREKAGVEAEMQEIKARAEQDGTFMKAPNGKASKLNERQWLQVRTGAFKEWFGDWELRHKSVEVVRAEKHQFKNDKEAESWAKSNIAKVYNEEETGGKGKIHISNNTISKYISKSAKAKSDTQDIHLSVLKVLPEIINTSVDVEQYPDFVKNENGERLPENGINKYTLIHRLYGAFATEGEVYRVKITLKELLYGDIPNVPHSYEATKIELLAGQNGNTSIIEALPRNANNSGSSIAEETNPAIETSNLLKGVEKSYDKGINILDDYSKVVDENGEPMVVYHGTSADFNEFNPNAESRRGRV